MILSRNTLLIPVLLNDYVVDILLPQKSNLYFIIGNLHAYKFLAYVIDNLFHEQDIYVLYWMREHKRRVVLLDGILYTWLTIKMAHLLDVVVSAAKKVECIIYTVHHTKLQNDM